MVEACRFHHESGQKDCRNGRGNGSTAIRPRRYTARSGSTPLRDFLASSDSFVAALLVVEAVALAVVLALGIASGLIA